MEAPDYDLLLKGGRVIDPAANLDGPADVAIAGGRIAAVGPSLAGRARKTIQVDRLTVTPGLIDMHMHAYGGYRGWIMADELCLPDGVTTAVDAGGAGWRTVEEFHRTIIAESDIRILAFLNIVGRGMLGPDVENDVDDMDPHRTAECVAAHPEYLIGIKTAHFREPGWAAVDRAVEAGRLCGKPAMVDFWPRPERSYPDLLLEHLRPGDIHTHVYAAHFPVLEDGKVSPFMWEARERGVRFDLGHGAGSFWFRHAIPAIEQGFLADTVSTDLHKYSLRSSQASMIQVMSKLLNIGVPLQEIIRRSTVAPAGIIGRPELGTLALGAPADVAAFAIEEGAFGFIDCGHARMEGTQRLHCMLTLREGEVMWDPDGLAAPDWRCAGEYWRLTQYGDDLGPARLAM